MPVHGNTCTLQSVDKQTVALKKLWQGSLQFDLCVRSGWSLFRRCQKFGFSNHSSLLKLSTVHKYKKLQDLWHNLQLSKFYSRWKYLVAVMAPEQHIMIHVSQKFCLDQAFDLLLWVGLLVWNLWCFNGPMYRVHRTNTIISSYRYLVAVKVFHILLQIPVSATKI